MKKIVLVILLLTMNILNIQSSFAETIRVLNCMDHQIVKTQSLLGAFRSSYTSFRLYFEECVPTIDSNSKTTYKLRMRSIIFDLKFFEDDDNTGVTDYLLGQCEEARSRLLTQVVPLSHTACVK